MLTRGDLEDQCIAEHRKQSNKFTLHDSLLEEHQLLRKPPVQLMASLQNRPRTWHPRLLPNARRMARQLEVRTTDVRPWIRLAMVRRRQALLQLASPGPTPLRFSKLTMQLRKWRPLRFMKKRA